MSAAGQVAGMRQLSSLDPDKAGDGPPFAAWQSARTSPRVYLFGALCLAVLTVMLFPIAMSLLASLKTTADASSAPPHYFPSALSVENYLKVLYYQAGLQSYLFNSLAVAFLTILMCLLLAARLPCFPCPPRRRFFSCSCSA
jgi:multiple sugar transport system permease protein